MRDVHQRVAQLHENVSCRCICTEACVRQALIQLEGQPMKPVMVIAAALLLLQKSVPGRCSNAPLVKALMQAEEDIVAVMAIEDSPSLCTIA